VYLARSPVDGGAGWWTYFNSTPISPYQVVSAVFLQLNVAIQLSIFSARTEGPFWIRRPGTWVLLAVFLGLLTATLIAALWTIQASFDLGDGALMDGIYDGKNVLLIYLYCIFWWLAMEFFKTLTYIVWEKAQFHDDAHFAQFFRISGWKKSDDVEKTLRAAGAKSGGGADEAVEMVPVEAKK
jgi:hypothetical protein